MHDAFLKSFTLKYRALTNDTTQLLQMLGKIMASMPGTAGEPYKNLVRYGEYFEKKVSTDQLVGRDKQCFQNSLVHPSDMYCGLCCVGDLPSANRALLECRFGVCDRYYACIQHISRILLGNKD